MTKTERLKLWVAEQFYGGYCEPEERDGYEWQTAISNATQTLKACKEAGLEFVEYWREHGDWKSSTNPIEVE